MGRRGGGVKKRKSRPLYQTQPEVYGKINWMATSERINLLTMVLHKQIINVFIYYFIIYISFEF